MAKYHGKNASIKKGGTTITNTTNWTLTIPGNLEDVPVHGDEWMHRITGIRDWTGSIDVLIDLATGQTTVQNLLLRTTPATGHFNFYINATAYFDGPGWIDSQDVSAPADGMVEGTFNISGNGTMNYNAS